MGQDGNVVLLREDAHTQWERKQISIVTKTRADNTRAWVVHVHDSSQELHALYHHRQLQPLTDVRCEFLFARFAWDVIPMLQGFLQRMIKRRLKLQ